MFCDDFLSSLELYTRFLQPLEIIKIKIIRKYSAKSYFSKLFSDELFPSLVSAANFPTFLFSKIFLLLFFNRVQTLKVCNIHSSI